MNFSQKLGILYLRLLILNIQKLGSRSGDGPRRQGCVVPGSAGIRTQLNFLVYVCQIFFEDFNFKNKNCWFSLRSHLEILRNAVVIAQHFPLNIQNCFKSQGTTLGELTLKVSSRCFFPFVHTLLVQASQLMVPDILQ